MESETEKIEMDKPLPRAIMLTGIKIEGQFLSLQRPVYVPAGAIIRCDFPTIDGEFPPMSDWEEPLFTILPKI